MSSSDTKSENTRSERGKAADVNVWRAPQPTARKARIRIVPFLITLVTTAVAVVLGWAMWNAYMVTTWTRDATVLAYVDTMAPQVAGQIVELPVADNQFVHKGDLLMLIDPTNYKIAVQQAEAALSQAQANGEGIDAQITVQQAQISANQAQVDQAKATLVFAEKQAARYQDLARRGAGSVQDAQQYTSQLNQQQATVASAQANLQVAQRDIDALNAQRSSAEATVAQAAAQLDQAKVNLERTQIPSSVNGWVTNLLTQVGDYATIGQNVMSVVDADSFWVDAYFEETQLASIHEGDPAKIKLMSYSQLVLGEVASVARGINVSNAQPALQGLANVNPIFTWVRLAQRVPVRIRIDQVPAGVTLVVGMTATVQVDAKAGRNGRSD